ncbi:MAG: peptidase, partial [Flavobacteriaceae bacterium]|nr:peptidase [Flavobacteriaceae bacterium]
LDLQAVLSALWQGTIGLKHKDNYIQNVQLNINFRVFTHLLNLAQQEMVHPQVNAVVHSFLKEKAGTLSVSKDLYDQELFRRYAAFLKSPENFKVIPAPTVPDGSPIGMNCSF